MEAVQIVGGPSSLEAELQQLRDLRRVNQELLVQTEELLQKEAREDAQFRSQFGIRWPRPQSSTLTKNLQDRLSRFAGNLKQATQSDARIERAVREHSALMAILDCRPVHSRNERGLSAITGNDVQNLRRDNFARDLNGAYDFSRGDYLEDNDLIDFARGDDFSRGDYLEDNDLIDFARGGDFSRGDYLEDNDLIDSFFCSENSSITSMSSDGIDREEFLHILGTPAIPDSNPEQYNSGLSLRDLEAPAIPATNQRNSDCHLNVAIPRGSHQILIQPAPSGSIGTSRNSYPRTNVSAVSASMGSDHARALPAAPVVEGRPVRRALNHGSAACEVNEVDQGPSTSQSAKVHGKRKAGSWRITKIGKKYCCFFQF